MSANEPAPDRPGALLRPGLPRSTGPSAPASRSPSSMCLLLAAALVLGARATTCPADESEHNLSEDARAPGTSVAQAVALSKSYLDASDSDNAQLAHALREYAGPIQDVIDALVAARETSWQTTTGVMEALHFTAPDLRDKYTDDLLYFIVPRDYDVAKPWGLLIFMHGGSKTSARTAAGVVVRTLEQDKYSYRLRRYVDHAPFITVAPSAPWNPDTWERWNVPEADEYIGAVIRECDYRFNIDRDRVFLGGQSMGGFGAYHLCQRLSDRIAGAIPCAGSWRAARWECMAGTPLFIVHGLHDSRPGGRPRYTDVFFGREIHRLLTEAGVEHTYAEHGGVHAMCSAGESLSRLVEWTRDKRRDPFYPRVVAVTPRGWNAGSARPSPHCRWVSVLEIGDGTIEFDSVRFTGPGMKWGEPPENWHEQKWIPAKAMIKAGKVDAQYKGKNLFEVATENVRAFSLWLHPNMVDFSQPVTVVVNGQERSCNAQPTLLDAIRSYQRRRDWGLIYHCELVLHVP